jgi:hypothetical protein
MPHAKEMFPRAILGTCSIGSPAWLTAWASNLYRKETYPFLWASAPTARGKITVSRTPKRLHYLLTQSLYFRT